MKCMRINGAPIITINPSISFYVECSSAEQTSALYRGLSNSSKDLMPLVKYHWNNHYAWVQDRYGLNWQPTTETGNTAQTIQPGMLFTGSNFGNAQTAIHLYTGLFASSAVPVLIKYNEDSGYAGKVLFSKLSIDGFNMIAMDGPGDHNMTFNEALSLVVTCEDQAAIDLYCNTLTADGGKEGRYGWLKDAYWVSWQIIPGKLLAWMADAGRHKQVGEKLMTMQKLDYATLQNA